jgi:hypothetical protein
VLTQRELDVFKEEQRARYALTKETVIQQFLGERYQLMPPAPPGVPKPEGPPEGVEPAEEPEVPSEGYE